MTAKSQKKYAEMFDLSKTVILNEGQSHPIWYQNVELSGLYYLTESERSCL